MTNINETDVPYAKTHGIELLGRLYQPEDSIGHGIVMIHGGAWTANDRITPSVMSHLLANRGLTVFSLDFRCGPTFQHPSASADIAAGIRYFRSHSSDFGIDPDKIGLIGSSSGGHLVLFTALQPNVPMHQTTSVLGNEEESVDASVSYVIALWPVSNPLARFEYALEVGRQELIRAHQGYFGSRETMHRASVQRLIRSREYTHLPPIFLVQPGEDANVPEYMTNDLLSAFRGVGHEVEYLHMPGLPHAFAYEASPDTDRCEAAVWDFIHPQFEN